MTVFSGLVFDESISGTLLSWTTSSEHEDALGAGDALAILASVEDLSGGLPSLTVNVEHSADGKDWIVAGTSIIATAIANNATYYGSRAAWPPLLAFVRLRVALGGSSPRCRLKLFAASHEAVRTT